MPVDDHRHSQGSDRRRSGRRELRFVLLRRGHIQAVFPVGLEALAIGRDPASTVVLQDPRASKNHAEVTDYEGELVIEDLGSRNGTRVNGRRIKTHALAPGDMVRIGCNSFVCLASGGPRARDPRKAVGWLIGGTIKLPVTEVPILIGRSADADIRVPDEEGPDFYAQIVAMPDGVRLSRLTADVPEDSILSDGDGVEFGSVRVEYRVAVLPEPKRRAATPPTGAPAFEKPTPVFRLAEVDALTLSDALDQEAERIEREMPPGGKGSGALDGTAGATRAPHRVGGCVLTATAGPCEGRSFIVTQKSLVVGRGKECDIRLDEKGVSRSHASIGRMAGDVVIEDLGSAIGVCLNGKRVRRGLLRPGDRVQIGASEFLVHL